MKFYIKQKNFNCYVFFTTISRGLVEVFVPVILYKFGYTLKEILFYYFFVNSFSIVSSSKRLRISLAGLHAHIS